MATIGTTIFSHIIPVILGFLAIIMVISGSLEESKTKLGLGIVLFVVACLFPYVILSILV
ncbi:MAG: hypothetical protein UHW99_01705 [Methanobrevibacter sp.]|uniref:hypothetical protein n=1 Tax=uncultured Methanobrevibacter sp. TaxID=253161 RepID=UPI0025EBF2FE|nr:hypothetical protein [uncultured Methanobrevibacter sp.]MEE1128675.1 hypothetical protein [Methanobrevibacter sp.]